MTDSPLTRVLTAHCLTDIDWIDTDGRAEQRRGSCECGFVSDWQTDRGAAVAVWVAHVVALVTAATQVEFARQFTSSHTVGNERATLTYNARQSPALLPGSEGR